MILICLFMPIDSCLTRLEVVPREAQLAKARLLLRNRYGEAPAVHASVPPEPWFHDVIRSVPMCIEVCGSLVRVGRIHLMSPV